MTGGDVGAGPGIAQEWQWDVVLSFAGAQRDYVEQVARALRGRGLRPSAYGEFSTSRTTARSSLAYSQSTPRHAAWIRST